MGAPKCNKKQLKPTYLEVLIFTEQIKIEYEKHQNLTSCCNSTFSFL